MRVSERASFVTFDVVNGVKPASYVLARVIRRRCVRLWCGSIIILKRSHYPFYVIREISFPLKEEYTAQREGAVDHRLWLYILPACALPSAIISFESGPARSASCAGDN